MKLHEGVLVLEPGTNHGGQRAGGGGDRDLPVAGDRLPPPAHRAVRVVPGPLRQQHRECPHHTSQHTYHQSTYCNVVHNGFSVKV